MRFVEDFLVGLYALLVVAWFVLVVVAVALLVGPVSVTMVLIGLAGLLSVGGLAWAIGAFVRARGWWW